MSAAKSPGDGLVLLSSKEELRGRITYTENLMYGHNRYSRLRIEAQHCTLHTEANRIKNFFKSNQY